MNDRPDLDEAIKIAQEGGLKITGGKYAPMNNQSLDRVREKIEKLAGSGAHACYCERSTDSGCKCALKDEYIDEIMGDINSELQNLRQELAREIEAEKRNEKREEKIIGVNPQYTQGFNVAIDEILVIIKGEK